MANLLQNLLSYAFHETAITLLDLKLCGILGHIFAQIPEERSIDLLLSILNVIEMITANADYRRVVCANSAMILNMGVLLMVNNEL